MTYTFFGQEMHDANKDSPCYKTAFASDDMRIQVSLSYEEDRWFARATCFRVPSREDLRFLFQVDTEWVLYETPEATLSALESAFKDALTQHLHIARTDYEGYQALRYRIACT